MANEGIKTKGVRRRSALVVLSLLFIVLLYNALFGYGYTIGPNYRNISIDVTVNITNAAPEILSITIPDPITLSAGTTQMVECNVSVRDWNGAGDINYTAGIFYHSTSTVGAADDNNTHYTNGSCAVTGQNGNFKNFTCGFSVYYYALNGTWTCNATVYDNSSYNDTALNTTTINGLLALNVTTLIDYGNLAVGDTSINKTANVTNFGNLPINVSVYGYGNVSGDGLAFYCEQGNISVDNERFSINASHDWTAKAPLASAPQGIAGLTVAKQTLPGTLITNVTYWQLYVPPNPFGVCNGTIVFQAESAT